MTAGLALGLAAGLAPAPALAAGHPSSGVDPAPPCTAGVAPSGFADRESITVAHLTSVDCLALYEVALGSGDPARPVFLPADTLTRAQMASFTARAFPATGRALPAPTEDFVDIEGSVHADAIRRLATLGVLQGRGDDRFAPAEPVRRDQAASILLRAAAAARGVDVRTLEREGGPFSDVTDTVHRRAINGARALGLVTGVTATSYRPDAPLTRAQMGSVIARWMNLEAPASASCTNAEDVYSLHHPAAWQVDDGSVLPTCSAFDPEAVEVPPASEVPLELAVVVRDLETTYDQAVTPGPGSDLLSEVPLTVDGHPAVRQELVGTGGGLVDAGVRWTRYLVDRGDRALQAATYDVPGNDYPTSRGVLTRMVLSLDLTGSGLPPFLPASSVTAQQGTAVDLDLTEVRSAHHEQTGYAFDRVVLEFTGDGTVGWNTTEWRDEAVLGGSGHVVPVEGDAVLSLAVTGHAVPQQPPFAGTERVPGPGLPVLEVVTGGAFEGVLDAFVGTAAPAPYRVFRLGGPERLVVDVQSDDPRVQAPTTAVVTTSSVSVVDVAQGRVVARLDTDGVSGRAVGFGDVAVHPDGRSVYAVAVIDAQRSEIHHLDVDGRDELVAVGDDVAVSPDGAHLAYSRPVELAEGQPTAVREELVVRDLATGAERRWGNAAPTDPELTADLESLTWSPDSQHLAFHIRFEDGVEVRVLDTSGGASVLDGHRVEPPEGSAFAWPAYRGTTGALAVVEQRGGLDPAIAPERFAVVEADAATGEVRATLTEPARPVIGLDFDSTGQHLLVLTTHQEHDAGGTGPDRLLRWSGRDLEPVPIEQDVNAAEW